MGLVKRSHSSEEPAPCGCGEEPTSVCLVKWSHSGEEPAPFGSGEELTPCGFGEEESSQ